MATGKSSEAVAFARSRQTYADPSVDGGGSCSQRFVTRSKSQPRWLQRGPIFNPICTMCSTTSVRCWRSLRRSPVRCRPRRTIRNALWSARKSRLSAKVSRYPHPGSARCFGNRDTRSTSKGAVGSGARGPHGP